MQSIIGLISQVLILSVLTMAAEFLLPSGSIKNTACIATRITYVAAICDEIIGIFIRWEV